MRVLQRIEVGDAVNLAGPTGTVATTVITPGNTVTPVGNDKVFGGTIQNASLWPVRRVERSAQLAVGVDPPVAIARLKAAVAGIPNLEADPASEVNPMDIDLNGRVISVRPYTHTDHLRQVDLDRNAAIVRGCRDAGDGVRPGLTRGAAQAKCSRPSMPPTTSR